MLYYFKHFLHRYLLKFDQILEHILKKNLINHISKNVRN